MSEHQVVAFRAIDAPVSEKNLEYMHKQSSRAEITPWAFDNEYHYGDFRGNAEEMLRRGYDLHLHYANYGTRRLMIRLPLGLPAAAAAKPYFDDESLVFRRDKKGPGGILVVEPFYESGELEELWEFEEVFEQLLPLRAEIMEGDLRPLYLANLAMARDNNHDPEETHEGPVPAGLDNLTEAQQALAELYELPEALIQAAAQGSPPAIARGDRKGEGAKWLASQPQPTKDAWLAAWLADAKTDARNEMLVAFRQDCPVPTWPTVMSGRTIAELETAVEEIHAAMKLKAAAQAARARSKKLAEMAANPKTWLKKTEELVAERTTKNYTETATILADLREALAGTTQATLADEKAQALKQKYPNAKTLTSELRRKGFLPK